MAARGLSGGVIALIVVDAVLVVALVALLISHPRPEGEPEAAPTPTEPVAAADEDPGQEEEAEPEPEEAEPALQPPDDAVSEAAFVTPSGNIWCEIDGDTASCTIGSHSYSVPDQPCDGPYGRVLQVTEDEATLPCLSEEPATSAPDSLPELDYGESTVVNDFWCTSEESGITCYSVMSGRGFSVARANYSTF